MPIFEFVCEKCYKTSEHILKVSEKPEKCPNCGNKVMEKVAFSKFAVGGPAKTDGCDAAPSCHSCCAGGACHHGKG